MLKFKKMDIGPSWIQVLDVTQGNAFDPQAIDKRIPITEKHLMC